MHTILLVMALTLGWNDGRLPSVKEAENPAPIADIYLDVQDTFAAEGRALGLDVIEEAGILGVNNQDMVINGYTAMGTISFVVPLDPANTSCFGAAFDPGESGCFYTSDWTDNDLYYSLDWGTSWRTVFDPAFDQGRGMDFDGTYYWITNGSGSIIRFIPEQTPVDTFEVPETEGQLSGLTIFDYEGLMGVALTAYGAQGIWFYLFDGTELEYLNFAAFPFTVQTSYGLAYASTLDAIFWSYEEPADQYYISLVEFDVTWALSQNTWAAIKASF